MGVGGTPPPVAPAANTVMLLAPVLATYSGLPTTRPVTLTVALADSPAAAGATTAAPAVAPPLNVVAGIPTASGCPPWTSSGDVTAAPTSASQLQPQAGTARMMRVR